jgi:ABC-type transport system substrate-binding protein
MVRYPIARRLLVSSVVPGLAAGLFVAAAVAATATHDAPRTAGRAVQEGGTLVIGIAVFDHIDPALTLAPNAQTLASALVLSWGVGDATCALLFRYPFAPPPVVRYDLVPEVATGSPAVSRNGTTYTFTIRKGYRFSTGAPVTAASYARAINRVLNPSMRSPAAEYLQAVVGADAVRQGRAATASGVRVAGDRLIIQLSRRVPDFPARMATPYFCPVPPGLPVDPEGVGAPLPGSGRYYVAEFVRGSRVVLERNPYYRGPRAHHLDRLVIEVGDDAATTTRKVEAGEQDVALGVPLALLPEIVAKYGVNKTQWFVIRSPMMFYLIMNTSRPLFRNNVKLRRAVSFAIDRTVLAAALGPTAFSATDDYLPYGLPGYRDGQVYPLRPDVAKAQALARGQTRGGTAVLYAADDPNNRPGLALAQTVQADLKLIGIDVQIQQFPVPVLRAKLGTRGEPFDLTFTTHYVAWVDPDQYVDLLLDGRTIRATGNTNMSYFNSAHYNGLIGQAGSLSGRARYAAYGRLAVDLAANAAPLAAFGQRNSRFFVSSRVGCVSAGAHYLDLAGLCLR